MQILADSSPVITVDLEVVPAWDPFGGREATPERSFTRDVRLSVLAPTHAAFIPFVHKLAYDQLHVRIVPIPPVKEPAGTTPPFAIKVRAPHMAAIEENKAAIFGRLLTGFRRVLLHVSKSRHLVGLPRIAFTLTTEQGWATILNDSINKIQVIGDTPPPSSAELSAFMDRPPNQESPDSTLDA